MTALTEAPRYMGDIVAQLDRRIAEKHLLTHPFYQAWNAGTLPRAALQDYAAQYYHHVAAFPAYLSAVHSNTPDLEARRAILQNLMDEEAGSPNHPELWLQFAEGVGVDRETVRNTPLQYETSELVAAYRDLCRREPFTDGVAALYAYESQIPEVAQTKMDGLRKHYDLSDSRTLAYFDIHVAADEVHRADERSLLSRHITTSEQADSACQAADRALDAVWNLLSGVCRRHNIVCD